MGYRDVVSDRADGGSSSPYSIDVTMQHVFDEYHRVIGLMSPSHYEKLNEWLEKGLEPALLAQAILSVEAEYQRRIRQNEPGSHQIRRMSYVEGILRNWYNDGLRTYYDWDAREDQEMALVNARDTKSPKKGGSKPSHVGTRDMSKQDWGWEV